MSRGGRGRVFGLTLPTGLDTPTAGAASVGGHDLPALDARSRLAYRRGVVGFVGQRTARNPLPYLTATQNVALPMRLAGRGSRRQRTSRADELLGTLGVEHCAARRPEQMSGGEQQRVAIAVVPADEPTGEPASATGVQILAAFRTANERLGATVAVVTHDGAVAGAVGRTVSIRDSRTAGEVVRRAEVDEHGHEATAAREFATVDRAGRPQPPRERVTALGIGHRVVLDPEPDRVPVRPDTDRAPNPGAEDAG